MPIGKGPLTIDQIEPVIPGRSLKARVPTPSETADPYQFLTGRPPVASNAEEEYEVAGEVIGVTYRFAGDRERVFLGSHLATSVPY